MEEISREVMPVDVVFIGAGPASLAAAYQLTKRIKEHDQLVDEGKLNEPKIGPKEIAVLEKTQGVGDAILSGAVMDPRGIEALMPDWKTQGAPIESEVTDDAVIYFTENHSFKLPITPPPLRNHGNYIISLSKFTRWLSQKVMEQGVNIFTGFAGNEVLYDDNNKVIGVRTGDKGIGKQGEKKANFEAGIDIQAKITVFGEGVRGSLTRKHIAKLGLDADANFPSFATGVKEVWELKPGRFPKGMVYHTMGFPQQGKTIGGGWLYGQDNNLLSLGYVTWLSYEDPFTDPHRSFQIFKTHPFIKKILEGGKLVQYGAKAVSVGGLYSIPQYFGDGFMMVGESANLVDGQRLKGVHMALFSGKCAGDAAFEALKKGDYSKQGLSSYQQQLEASDIFKELYSSRNFHQAFDKGFMLGMLRTGIQTILRGKDILGNRVSSHLERHHLKTLKEIYGWNQVTPPSLKFDNQYLYDKLTDIYNSGTIHEEDQPPHLLVPDRDLCANRCSEEYGNPCVHFCPAQVYEMEEKNGKPQLKLNASNCVHCKTCDIMDPYNNITWKVPEGGGGPRYTVL